MLVGIFGRAMQCLQQKYDMHTLFKRNEHGGKHELVVF
jgi:hypothetical protein